MDATRSIEQFHLLFLAQLARRVKPGLFVLEGGLQPPLLPREHPLLGGHGPRRWRDGRSSGTRCGSCSPPGRSPRSSRPATSPSSAPLSRRRPRRPSAGRSAFASRGPARPCRRRSSAPSGSGGRCGARQHRPRPWPVGTGSRRSWSATTTPRLRSGRSLVALAGRQETQARDVFDLHLLLSRGASLRSGPERPDPIAARAPGQRHVRGLRHLQEPGALLPRAGGSSAVRLAVRMGHDRA